MSQLASLLDEHSDALLKTWTERVRREGGAGEATTSELRNHLPLLLNEMKRTLRRGATTTPPENAVKHGRQRYRLGFTLDMLIREYGVLSDIILGAAQIHGLTVGLAEVRCFTDFISQALASGVSEHCQQSARADLPVARRELRASEEREANLATISSSIADAVVCTDATGRVTVLRDSTAQRDRDLQISMARQSQDAAEAGRRLHDLFMQAPVAIAIYEGDDHVYAFANAPYLELIGFQSVVGKPLLKVFPALEDQGIVKRLDEVLSTAQPHVAQEVPLQLLGNNDAVRYFTFTLAPKRRADGVVDGVLVVAADVTEQVSARQNAERLVGLLRDTEEKQRRLVEASGAGTWELEVATGDIVANHRMTELMGMSQQSNFDLGWGIERLPYEEDKQRVKQAIAAALAGKNNGHYRVEFRTGGLRGEPVRWVESRAKTTFGADSTPLRLGGTMVDITERKVAEALLKRQADFERQLIGIVSHDLKNPLAAISLAAEALLRRVGVEDKTASKVSRIAHAAQRALRMIRDLLDFTQARLGTGIPIAVKPFNIHILVASVVNEVQTAFPGRNIDVQSFGLGDGEWDADRVAQVVQNLVTNALNYSPADSRVRVETHGLDSEARITVHNVGMPIPPGRLAAIFEPMQRATASELDAGSRSIGLGLYIVQSIVEAHAGSIVVTSTEHEGTLFTVVLPRREELTCRAHPTAPQAASHRADAAYAKPR